MTARPMQRGFTLSETLAVLAVAGIGLSLAAPSLKSLSGRNQQAVSVNQLVSTMHLARSEAVMRNARVAVCASATGESCDGRAWEDGWIAFVDADANQERAAGEMLIDHITALPGLRLRSAEFAQSFAYRPDGRVIAADGAARTGEFAFCEPGATAAARVVIVRASGLPTLAQQHRDGSSSGCDHS